MFKRFASFQVTSAVLVPQDASQATLRRIAHRHDFSYEPRPGFLYVRSRAISSRTNDNYDEFPAEEIKQAYRTFVGKPVFVNHVNDNHTRARGVIIDAALHEDRLADGSPDTWAEVLMEIDAVRFPKLAKAIIEKRIDRTSMGCDVAYSVCSACGNKASTPAEYCQHIPRLKGKKILKRNASTGAQEEHLIRETCYGLKFFENSVLVEEPADPTAHFLGDVDTRGLQTAASRKTADFGAHEISRAIDQASEEAGKQHMDDLHYVPDWEPLRKALPKPELDGWMFMNRHEHPDDHVANVAHDPALGKSWEEMEPYFRGPAHHLPKAQMETPRGLVQYKHGISRKGLMLDEHGQAWRAVRKEGYNGLGQGMALTGPFHPKTVLREHYQDLERFGHTPETKYNDDFIADRNKKLKDAGYEVVMGQTPHQSTRKTADTSLPGPSSGASDPGHPHNHLFKGNPGQSDCFCGSGEEDHPHPSAGQWARCSTCKKDMSHHLHDQGRYEHLADVESRPPSDGTSTHLFEQVGKPYGGHDHRSASEFFSCPECRNSLDEISRMPSSEEEKGLADQMRGLGGEDAGWLLDQNHQGPTKFSRKTAAADQESCSHNYLHNLHGQCMNCGYMEPTEADEECDEPYCKDNGFPEGWHTKGEHIDPVHLDPYHPDHQDLARQLENLGSEDERWLLGQQSEGPSKYSQRKTAQWFYNRSRVSGDPIVHPAGQPLKDGRRGLDVGDHVLFESGHSARIHAVTPNLLMLEGHSGPMHRGPIEGDHSRSIWSSEVTEEAGQDVPSMTEEQRQFLDQNQQGPTKFSSLTHFFADNSHRMNFGDPEKMDAFGGQGWREHLQEDHGYSDDDIDRVMKRHWQRARDGEIDVPKGTDHLHGVVEFLTAPFKAEHEHLHAGGYEADGHRHPNLDRLVEPKVKGHSWASPADPARGGFTDPFNPNVSPYKQLRGTHPDLPNLMKGQDPKDPDTWTNLSACKQTYPISDDDRHEFMQSAHKAQDAVRDGKITREHFESLGHLCPDCGAFKYLHAQPYKFDIDRLKQTAPFTPLRQSLNTLTGFFAGWEEKPCDASACRDGAPKGSPASDYHTAGEHSEWAQRKAAEGTHDAWGIPLKKPYDGHGAFDCNDFNCAEHPQEMYEQGPGPVGMPGWLKHDTDPNRDLAREVGKAFHEQGLTEDARYLLDQQHQGPTKYSSSNADGWTECEQGHRHWGRAGAAGVLIRHTDDSGTRRYLLQHRAPWVDEGGTWSIPGGALGHEESPEHGALREAHEELGNMTHGLKHVHTHTDDHGGWAYHTVIMDSPSRFGASGSEDGETGEGGYQWLTADEINGLPLHPGFKKTWPKVQKHAASGDSLRHAQAWADEYMLSPVAHPEVASLIRRFPPVALDSPGNSEAEVHERYSKMMRNVANYHAQQWFQEDPEGHHEMTHHLTQNYLDGHQTGKTYWEAARKQASWIGDHPEEPTLFWRAPKSKKWEVHIENHMPDRDLREGYGAKPSQQVILYHADHIAPPHPNAPAGSAPRGGWRVERPSHYPGEIRFNPTAWGNVVGHVPPHVMNQVHNALAEVDRHAQNHADLYGQVAHQRDEKEDEAKQDADIRFRNKQVEELGRPFDADQPRQEPPKPLSDQDLYSWLYRQQKGDHTGSRKTASDDLAEPTGTCEQCGLPNNHIHLDQSAIDEIENAARAGQMYAEMHDSAQKRVVNTADHHDLKAHLLESHGYTEDDFWRTSHDEDHSALDHQGFDDEDRPLHRHEVRRLHDWEHGHGVENEHPDYDGGLPGHFMGESHFHTAVRKTAMGPAQCSTCGESIRVNPNTHTRDGDPIPNDGWHHHDGFKRDHLARPHDGRSADDQRTQDRAAMDQARMEVREHMQRQFSQVELGHSVDEAMGFYKCPECRGGGWDPTPRVSRPCLHCDGTGKIKKGGNLSRVASDYRMQHQAPDEESGAPIHDLTGNGIYPGDIYTHPHYYVNDPHEWEGMHKARKVQGKPDSMVWVYRAVPHGVKHINPGDWVTTSREYARNEGHNTCSGCGGYQVLKAPVRAKHLHTEGNSLAEWGYNGPEPVQTYGSYRMSCPSQKKQAMHVSDGQFWAKPEGKYPDREYSEENPLGLRKEDGPFYLTRHPETRAHQVVDRHNRLIAQTQGSDGSNSEHWDQSGITTEIFHQYNQLHGFHPPMPKSSDGHDRNYQEEAKREQAAVPPFEHSTTDPRVEEFKARPAAREHAPEGTSPGEGEEWHGPYEVVKHPETGKYHVVDNAGRAASGPWPWKHKGHDTQWEAESNRDDIDRRVQSKENAKRMVDGLWEGIAQAFDPGSTPESRRTDRYADRLNNLMHTYEGGPQHPLHPGKFDWDDEEKPGDKEGQPYYEVEDPGGSGFTARDYGGANIHIYHRAKDRHSGDETPMDLVEPEGGTEGGWSGPGSKREGFDHDELHKELHRWIHGDPNAPEDERYAHGPTYAGAYPHVQAWQRRKGYKG